MPSNRSRLIGSALILLTLLTTAVICFCLYHHIYLNGSRFCSFTWHRAGFFPLISLIAVSAIPVLLISLRPPRPLIALPLLTLACLALELTSSTLQNNSLSLAPIIRYTADAPLAHGFFHDAEDLIRTKTSPLTLLRTYPQRMRTHRYHVRNKGPLTILYYYCILCIVPESAARDTAALVGALGLGLLSALAIPATYYMIRAFDLPPPAALLALCAYVLMPAQLVFLPDFDTFYVSLTALLIAFWWHALTTHKKRYAVAAALTVSITTLFAFNTLIIGALLIALTLYHIVGSASANRLPVPARAKHAFAQLFTATATVLLFHLLLYLATGYNPISTFIEAWRQQHIAFHEFTPPRPWPTTIPTDLTNFLYPLGFLPVILFASYFLHPSLPPIENFQFTILNLQSLPPRLSLALICLAFPLFLALTGLLPSETHRLWLFAIPSLLIPIALELPRWPPHHRLTFHLCQCAVLVFITQNLKLKFY